MSSTSTLRTPVTPTLTLSRPITPRAISVEIQDETGRALYTEEIALGISTAAAPATPTEPTDPEQVEHGL